MSEHALLSFSASPRWLQCSGSLHFEQTMPEPPSSPAADRGTAIHDAAALALVAGRPVAMPEDPDGQEWGQRYVDYVNALATGPEARVLVEQRVVYTERAWGTADAIVLNPFIMDIVDLKTGQHRVDASTPQLALYALAALREFNVLPSPIHHRAPPVEVRLHIIQPSLDWVDVRTFKPTDLAMLAGEVDRVEMAVERQAYTYNPSEDACRWCRGRDACAARAEHFHQIAVRDFEVAAPAELQLADYQRILPHIAEIIAWCEGVKAHCTKTMIEGGEIPGFKLVATAQQRRWTDPKTVARALIAAGIPEALTTRVEPITISAAEKILGKGHPLFAEQTKQVGGNPAIVRDTDPRPRMQLEDWPPA